MKNHTHKYNIIILYISNLIYYTLLFPTQSILISYKNLNPQTYINRVMVIKSTVFV